jgi:cupin 2 domain-containing protein
MKNLFAEIPSSLPKELMEQLLQTESVRIERIISWGHASPPGFWYDQDHAEWVAVLAGAARLEFADGASPIELKPGDYLTIPAHQRHRLAWTTPDEPTIWLAVHCVGSSE